MQYYNHPWHNNIVSDGEDNKKNWKRKKIIYIYIYIYICIYYNWQELIILWRHK